MASNATTNGTSTPVPADAGASSGGPHPRKLKILMLHGFTQSGPLFHAKTRALEKSLQKAFPAHKSSPLSSPYPGGVQLIYPTAPIRLHPADIPGFDTSAAQGSDPESDAWGWWRKDEATGKYIGMEQGLGAIRDAIREVGGIDGVIGFSQGGAAAAAVASLLDPGRKKAFEDIKKVADHALEYPEGWEELNGAGQGQLKFAVSYSGFYAPDARYRAFYEPRIKTPVLSFIGSLDSVVDESRSLGLVERCVGKDGEKGRMVFHPGGHFVPVGKEWVGILVGFIRECCIEVKKEGSAEDVGFPASFL